MSIRGGGARVSAWPACRTENGSAVSELRRRSASAASWSGSRADPTEYKVAARASRPIGGLSSGSSPSVRILSTCPHQLDRRKPIQALADRRRSGSPQRTAQSGGKPPFAPVSCRAEASEPEADQELARKHRRSIKMARDRVSGGHLCHHCLLFRPPRHCESAPPAKPAPLR